MCDRCEELEERVRQLEGELYHTEWEAPSEFGLTYMEARIVGALIARDKVCRQSFLIAATRDCAGTKTEFPHTGLIDAKICHIRRKLKPYGLEIETVWGRGYRLTASSRQALLDWNNQAEAA